MKLFLSFVLCFVAFFLSAQQWSWTRNLGPYVYEIPMDPQITTLSNGQVICLDQFETLVSGSLQKSCRLQGLDPGGQVVWKDSTSGHHEAGQLLGNYSGGFFVISGLDMWISGASVLPTTPGSQLTFIDGAGNRKWARILTG